jgi:HK97 family phage prohead protease
VSARRTPLYGMTTDWHLPVEHEFEALKAPWRLPERRTAKRRTPGRSTPSVIYAEPQIAHTFVPQAEPAPLEDLGAGVVSGLAVPWRQWTTIHGEGPSFRENFAEGAFSRTLQARDRPVVSLFQHGHDSSVGGKVLGPISVHEASDGLRFQVAFLDAGYAREIAVGAKAGLYGASVRFGTIAPMSDVVPAKPQATNEAWSSGRSRLRSSARFRSSRSRRIPDLVQDRAPHTSTQQRESEWKL